MIDVKDISYWEMLKEKVKKHVGFNCDLYSDKFLSRRIEVRIRALSLNSYARYADILETDSSEKDKLLKELTIHVTHFFRDFSFYDLFMKELILLFVQS